MACSRQLLLGRAAALAATAFRVLRRMLVPFVMLPALLASGCGGEEGEGTPGDAPTSPSSPSPAGENGPRSGAPSGTSAHPLGDGSSSSPAPGHSATDPELVRITTDGVTLEALLTTAAGPKRRVAILLVRDGPGWQDTLRPELTAAGASVMVVALPRYKDHLNGYGDRDLALVENDVDAAVRAAQSLGYPQVALFAEHYAAVGAAKAAGKHNLTALVINSPRIPVSADLSGLKTSKAKKLYSGGDQGGVPSASFGLLTMASSGTPYQMRNFPDTPDALGKDKAALQLVVDTLAK